MTNGEESQVALGRGRGRAPKSPSVALWVNNSVSEGSLSTCNNACPTEGLLTHSCALIKDNRNDDNGTEKIQGSWPSDWTVVQQLCSTRPAHFAISAVKGCCRDGATEAVITAVGHIPTCTIFFFFFFFFFFFLLLLFDMGKG
jgi:hypothetical protein